MDWWNIRDEHTPYQWAVQRLLYSVDPFGPRRDDLRAAWNTAKQIIMNSPAEVSPEDAQSILEDLRNFLKCHTKADESIYDAQALERMKHGDTR